MAAKDVEALLLNERPRRRRPGDLPYPLDYTTDMLNFDIWNNMFLIKWWKRLTMHDFKSNPPSVVLDLGCGGGFWAMEAAKEWPESIIIGFDVKDIQPRLELLNTHQDLARRVKWVHGNLLDGLPFAPDHFDFVRIVGIGLGVPEDEWQYVLEEISRVMKPGAVLEMVEDDLIFPCGRPPIRPRRAPPIAVELPNSDTLHSSAQSIRTTSSTLLSTGDSLPSSAHSTRTTSSTLLSAGDPFHLNLEDLQYSTDSHSLRRKSNASNAFSFVDSPPSISPKTPHSGKMLSSFLPSPVDIPEEEEAVFEHESHPQDHTRLKASWDAMLNRRFLAPNVNTVLPFYLSSCFTDVQSLPILQVPLPSNSESRNPQHLHGERTSDDSDSMPSYDANHQLPRTRPLRTLSDVHSSSVVSNSNPRTPARKQSFPHTPNGMQHQNGNLPPIEPAPTWAPTPTWTSTHLAKVMKTVIACKEAIWAEYQLLYAPELPPVTKTARPGQIKNNRSKSSAREDFEKAWSNWEADMIDRMGLRDRIAVELSWMEPPGERPDWLVWRNNLETLRQTSFDDPSSLYQDTEPCRSMRGFIAWKPPR